MGGFGAIFGKAATISPHLLNISPVIDVGYTTLALGSALALFLYPHAITGTLGAKDSKTIRRNASLLPTTTAAKAKAVNEAGNM